MELVVECSTAFGMARDGSRWLGMARDGSGWLGMARDGSGWLEMLGIHRGRRDARDARESEILAPRPRSSIFGLGGGQDHWSLVLALSRPVVSGLGAKTRGSLWSLVFGPLRSSVRSSGFGPRSAVRRSCRLSYTLLNCRTAVVLLLACSTVPAPLL